MKHRFFLFLACLFPLCAFAEESKRAPVEPIPSSQEPVLEGSEPYLLVREDYIPEGKGGAYEIELKQILSSSNPGWKGVVIESIDKHKYLTYFPFSQWSQLQEYFSKGERIPSTVFMIDQNVGRLLPSCSYFPNEESRSWFALKWIYVWIYNPRLNEQEKFEKWLTNTIACLTPEVFPYVVRTLKVTLGDKLPKYAVTLYAKSEDELDAAISIWSKQASQPEVGGSFVKISERKGHIRSDLH